MGLTPPPLQQFAYMSLNNIFFSVAFPSITLFSCTDFELSLKFLPGIRNLESAGDSWGRMGKSTDIHIVIQELHILSINKLSTKNKEDHRP